MLQPTETYPQLFRKLDGVCRELLGTNHTAFHQAVYNKVWWHLFHCQNDGVIMAKLLAVELGDLERVYNKISGALVDVQPAFFSRNVSREKTTMFINDIRRAYVVGHFVKLMTTRVTYHTLERRLEELALNVKHLNKMEDRNFYYAVCDISLLLTLIFSTVMTLENENRAHTRSMTFQAPSSISSVFRELSIRSMLNAAYGNIEALNVFESIHSIVQPFTNDQADEMHLFIERLDFKNQELVLTLPAIGKLLRKKK